MAARNRRQIDEDMSDLDEVDAFTDNQEKILFEQAGSHIGNRGQNDNNSSEEEVMALEDDESQDEEILSQGSFESSNEDENGDSDALSEEAWGGRQHYYGGDDISDDEGDKEMAEEALRLQKKHLKELSMNDFIDEEMMKDWQEEAEKDVEEPKSIKLSIDQGESVLEKMNDNEKLNFLNDSFPEFRPLLKEFIELKTTLRNYAVQKDDDLVNIKKMALSAYLSSLASYFSLFAEKLKKGDIYTGMKDNNVMETILKSREAWRQTKMLFNIENTSEPQSSQKEPQSISDLESESESDSDSDHFMNVSDNSESAGSEIFDHTIKQPDTEFDIDINVKRQIKHNKNSNVDDVDLEDKQRRKRTLRFYTAKIDKAEAKNFREISGDNDLPYKERLYERQQKLLEEARRRGLGEIDGQVGEDLGKDDTSALEEEYIQASDDEDLDNYYQSMKNAKLEKRKSRKEAHNAAVTAAKEGKLLEAQEEVDEDGKRAINYQILKNKGLTPHRRKENRNARVKKRKKYEKAQKKLKSVRQVYNNHDTRGPYQGETTGIKKNVSRSVKLV